MRYLLDKSVVRRCLRGLLGGTLTEDVQQSLILFTNLPEASLYISLETFHILTHIVKVPQGRFLADQTQVLYPVRYTRRWARRLREMNFGREDAYLLSLATFGTDRIKQGHILGVHAFLTYDERMIRQFHARFPLIEARLKRMTAQLNPPYCFARLPRVCTPADVL
ncbi:MAG: hypothetical protein D6791_17585 [Chloroflexi bacterium]|nr:MAG: hypothetical protein D6791_17585 [Chloroflexota bacterium]